MIPSTPAKAMQSPTTHTHIKGRFFETGPLPLPVPGKCLGRAHQCQPVEPLPDGEVRVLRAPGGALLTFRWVAKEKAWARAGGYRLAFPATYLGLMGWTYTGLVAPLTRSAAE